jgi:WD40 repeat protein
MTPQALITGWFSAMVFAGLAAAAAQEQPPPLRRPQLWAIVVGISDYRDPQITDSGAAADQAAEVLRWFRATGWDEDHQLLLRDFGSSDPGAPDNPAPNILPLKANLDWATQRWLLHKAKPDDTVVFYFAGRASAVVTPRGAKIEPQVDFYLQPIDGFQVDPAASGWSLDRVVDDCARRRIQVVCWLATSFLDRLPTAPGRPPLGVPRAPAISNSEDWLRRLTRWPGVTAWLATDRPPGVGEAADFVTPFTTALVESLGKPEQQDNLAGTLKRLQQNPRLKRQGFRTMGGVPPDLSLWADQFGRPVNRPPPELVLQSGHADKVTALVSRADSRLVVSASMDSTVRVWSTRQRSLLHILTGHMVGASALALSGNDRWLISGGGRGVVLVHDLNDLGLLPAPKQPHNKSVRQITLLPDGSHFITVDSDASAALWDLSVSPLEPISWPDPEKGLKCREVVAGGKGKLGLVAARTGDGKVQIFDPRGANGVEVHLPEGRVTALAVGPDGRTLAAGFEDGRVLLVDVNAASRDERRVASGPVRGLAFSQTGWLAVNHKKGVQLLRISRGAEQTGEAAIDLFDQAAGCMSVSPDGRYLAVCTENIGALRAWRLDSEKPSPSLVSDETAGASTVGFTGDSQNLLIGGFAGSLASRLLEGGKPGGEGPWTVVANRGKVQRVDSSPSRRFLLLVNEMNQAQVWDVKNRTCRRLPGAWASGIFLGDDEIVLTAVADAPRDAGQLIRARREGVKFAFDGKFFSRSEGAFRIRERPAFEQVTLSPDRTRIAATAGTAQLPLVCVWDAKTGKLTHWISSLQDPVRSLCFSSDGRHLLTAGDSPEAKLWNLVLAEGELKTPSANFVDPHATNITATVIRPNHNQLVTGHSDGQVNLWSWKDGRAILEVQQLVVGAFAGAVKALAFMSDGRTLAAAGDGTTIWLGTMEPQPAAIGDLDELRPHHSEQINTLLAWPGQSMLISGSDDTTVKFWDIKGRKLWGTFSAACTPADPDQPADTALLNELDWVLYTPEGMFDGTPEGTKLVRFRKHEQANHLAQYEATHFAFRLGELLLSGKPAPLVRKAETAPSVTITAPVRSDTSVPETELLVSLGGADLKDVRLYHNDRPIPTGLDARKPCPPQFPVRVRLLDGTNHFYAMASRDGFVDSRSDEVEILYDGPMESGRLHVVALGVADYKARRLAYPVRDADQLSKVLHKRGLGALGEEGFSTVLPDSQVNHENVEKAFDEIARRVEDRPQDTVVVFVAGHTGVFNDQQFCLLLPSFEFAPGQPALARARDVVPNQTANQPVNPDDVLPYSVIAANMMRLKALNRLVIVDACQAEAILEDPQVGEIQKWMEIGSRRARTSYLMAARRGEPALEVDPLRHGLFTYTLLRGMGAIDPANEPEEVSRLNLRENADFNGDGLLSTGELDSYVTQNLPAIAQLFPGLVARREAELPKGKRVTPAALLDQRPSLQGVNVSFPLVPVTPRPAR